MRILLIDDSAAYHAEFARLLGDSGVTFSALDHAADAEEGARLMAADAHHIYFVDYRLPAMDGLSLVRDARRTGSTRPIVVLTAFDSPQIDAAAEAAGATDYLPKGEFTPAMLGRCIRYARRNTEAVQAARAAEARFQMAQDAAGIGTWDWDIRNQTVVWSPQQYQLFGIDPGIQGRALYGTWLQAVHPDDIHMAQARLAAALVNATPLQNLFRILRRDPASPGMPPVIRWIASKGEVVRDASGTPVRMIGINIDVTAQQAELAALRDSHDRAVSGLHDSEMRFQTYFNSAPDCMFHVRRTPDGRFVYDTVNAAALAASGRTLDQLRGRTPEEVLGPEKGGMMTAGLQQVYDTGLPFRYEPTWAMPSGAVTYDAVYMPLRNAAGEIAGVLGVARDVTEHRRMEAALNQSQKMEALGQLASGVAHDFNNLLTSVLGAFELLDRHVASAPGQRLLAQGRKAVERGTALTSRLLAFSRQQPMETRPIDLNASLVEMSEMLGRTLGTQVRIDHHLAPDLWPAAADRNQIELAILNLAINARDAMPLGGTLTIETRNETMAGPQPDGLAAGDYAVIAISDTGSGMTPGVLARVTEPFFTTKDSGKGTGLGLSMVFGLMQQLGGGMRIASEVDKGTCVTIYLPRAHAPAETAAAAPWSVGPARILLVDDNADTQSVVRDYAAEQGHSVAVATSAAEALALLDSEAPIDILIAAGTLPGLSGAALIAKARTRRASLPAMIVSAQPGTCPTGASGDVPVLAKPFTQETFNKAIAALLPAASATILRLPQKAAG